MHYVVSDIHGCYWELKEMLQKISFSKNDILYVNGDVIDRGAHPIAALNIMMQYPNIKPIIGNHEWMALEYLASLVNENELKETDNKEELWCRSRHKTTIKEYMLLCARNKKKIVEYISSFSRYEEVTVNGIQYLIMHAGMDWDGFSIDKDINSYDLGELVWAETDYDKVYYRDKILITGHSPTMFIDKNYSGRILKKNNHIAIDCGCVFGGRLGCICLETGEEYYVNRYGEKHALY